MSHPFHGIVYAQPDHPPSRSRSTALTVNEADASKIKTFWSDFWREKDPDVEVSIENYENNAD